MKAERARAQCRVVHPGGAQVAHSCQPWRRVTRPVAERDGHDACMRSVRLERRSRRRCRCRHGWRSDPRENRTRPRLRAKAGQGGAHPYRRRATALRPFRPRTAPHGDRSRSGRLERGQDPVVRFSAPTESRLPGARPEDPRRPHQTTPLIPGVNTTAVVDSRRISKRAEWCPALGGHLEPVTTAEVALERDRAGRAERDESGSIERRQGGRRQKRRERPGVRRNDGGGEEPGSGAGTGC